MCCLCLKVFALGSSNLAPANPSLLSANTQPQGRDEILLFLPHGKGKTKLELGSNTPANGQGGELDAAGMWFQGWQAPSYPHWFQEFLIFGFSSMGQTPF